MPELVFLYGSGRAGTTWLEERIANALGAEVIFEPLQPELGPRAASHAWRYLPPEVEAPELRAWLDDLIAGREHSIWTRYRILPARLRPGVATMTRPAEFKAWLKRYPDLYRNWRRYRPTLGAQCRLLKFIRANLLIPWMVQAYPQAVHLAIVRHPAAVIESRMRLDREAARAGLVTGRSDWSALTLLQRYLAGPLPPPLAETLSRLPPPESLPEYDRQCILWCVENHYTLTCDVPCVSVYFHETLLDGASPAWGDLALQLGVQRRDLLDGMARPSQQASTSGGFCGGTTLGSHSSKLSMVSEESTDEVAATLQNYLALFCVRSYVAGEIQPLNAAQAQREPVHGA